MNVYDVESSVEALCETVIAANGVTVATSRTEDALELPFCALTVTSEGVGETATLKTGERLYLTWRVGVSVDCWLHRDAAATQFSVAVVAVRRAMRLAELYAAAEADATIPHYVRDVRETGAARGLHPEHAIDIYTLNFSALVGTKQSAIDAMAD